MKLTELIAGLPILERAGDADPEITRIDYDSRRAAPGSLFVAMPGFKTDGAKFVRDAIARGAAAIVGEAMPAAQLSIPFLRVDHSRRTLAELSWRLYGNPERKLKLAAITGTNGKTTVANALTHVLNHAGLATGVCGTLGISYGDEFAESPRTTPESADLAPHLARMAAAGFSCCVMEATSIGIALDRIHALPFAVSIFTNLTRDHLDFHGSWEAYLDAKLRLFREMSSESVALINLDDPAASAFIEQASGRVLTYGFSARADFHAKDISLAQNGTRFVLRFQSEDYPVRASLIGRFNVQNLTAVFAAALSLGLTPSDTLSAIASIPVVRGRAEVVPSAAPFTVVVDYAHTPDALQKILESLRELRPNRVLTVIGAGGDRDRGKRPEMTRAAEAHSDLIILTSDNPRSEDPSAILDDMAAGITDKTRFVLNPDRRSAIQDALSRAVQHDVVLIAGKGHETYQETGGIRHPFDDRQVALEWLQRAGFAA